MSHIGKISGAYIRGRRDFLQQKPARADQEPSLELKEYYRLGYSDARAQARAGIVQLQFALDSPDERNETVPISHPEGTPP